MRKKRNMGFTPSERERERENQSGRECAWDYAMNE
jgi:hypothetical protein